MKNTDYNNYKQFENAISAAGELDAVMGLMKDLDLQIVDIVKA